MTWVEKEYKQMLLEGSGSINYNKGIAKTYGINVAILLGLLCYKYDYWIEHDGITEDGYFFVTQEDIEEETGLSPHQQREAIKVLKDNGILSIYRKGMPPKNYYKLNYSTLKSQIIESNKLKNLTYIDEKIEPINVKKLNTTNKEITNKEITNKEVTKYEEDNLNKSSSLSPNISSVPKERNKDISDSAAATSVRTQVYAAYPELAEVIIKWYNEVGIKKKLSFNQIRDKVETLKKECNGDAKLAEQQINYSYMNGYLAWYPPKEIKKKSVCNTDILKKANIKRGN